MNEVASCARARLAEARSCGAVPRAILPALLPTSLCDRYLAQMTAPGFDPFRDVVEASTFARQMRLTGRKIARRF
jgi:hypothetical protein